MQVYFLYSIFFQSEAQIFKGTTHVGREYFFVRAEQSFNYKIRPVNLLFKDKSLSNIIVPSIGVCTFLFFIENEGPSKLNTMYRTAERNLISTN